MDSPNKKEFGEEFLYIKFNQDFLKAFYGWRFQDYSTHLASLKAGVVPSISAWKRISPRKRPSPTPRLTNRIEILI